MNWGGVSAVGEISTLDDLPCFTLLVKPRCDQVIPFPPGPQLPSGADGTALSVSASGLGQTQGSELATLMSATFEIKGKPAV